MKYLTNRRLILVSLVGVFVGIFSLFAVRFIVLKNTAVHYHANFGLYINGQRDEFKSFAFYEEIQSCSADEINDPKTRAHLHNQNNHVIHVHARAATWGHLIDNLGYTLGDNVVKTDQGVFVDGVDSKHLNLVLNGQKVKDLANRTINSEDVALISYGSETETELQQQYKAIPRDAGEFNRNPDPASCGGSKPLSTKERLRKTFDLRY